MDKQLHIQILEVLQRSNAIGNMVDIKPAFEGELNSQEARKNFKAQIDYLLNEGMIETTGRFEYLGWELLQGLYPIDNKRIEARLVGNWESYLAAKRGSRSTSADIPVALPVQKPAVKDLYDIPSTVLPYPGVNLNKPAQPDDDFTFKTKSTPQPANPANEPQKPEDVYLKEDDFLPFKVRNSASFKATKADETEQTAKPAFEEPPIATDNHTPPEPQKSEEIKPADFVPFSESKTTFTPPVKTNTPDIAVTVKPFSAPKYTPPDVIEKPLRIQGHVRRDADDDWDNQPIFTSRASANRKNTPPPPLPQPEPFEEPKPTPVASRVINLHTPPPTPVPDAAPIRKPVAAAPVPLAKSDYIPPPPSNHSSIKFDTENNPFNGLGAINLLVNSDKDKKSNKATIIRWVIITAAILFLLACIAVYKRKYGA